AQILQLRLALLQQRVSLQNVSSRFSALKNWDVQGRGSGKRAVRICEAPTQIAIVAIRRQVRQSFGNCGATSSLRRSHAGLRALKILAALISVLKRSLQIHNRR